MMNGGRFLGTPSGWQWRVPAKLCGMCTSAGQRWYQGPFQTTVADA